jgi:hypothetical protein
MAIGQSSYWGAAGTEPNPFAGWSEERKRFFELNGYDRGPTPPETIVKVTETPPDDPTPTTRVTTTKYPEGMDQPGMQGDPYAGLLGGQETAPDPLAMWQEKGYAETGVDPDDINLREKLQEQGRYEEDVAGSYDRPQIQHPFLPAYDDPVTSRDEFDLAMRGRDVSGDKVLWTEDGIPVTFQDFIMDSPDLLVGGGVGAVWKLQAIIRRAGGLSAFIQKNLGRLRDIARRKGKPTKKPTKPKDTGEVFIGRSRADAEAAERIASTGGRGTAAGGFAPIRTGIKTGLKVATPLAAVGLLDEGSEEERAAGEWPGLVELKGMPWRLKRAYDASRSALEAAGEFVTEKGGALVEGLVATEEDLDIKEAQEAASPSQRYEGLLSAAEVAGLKPAEIAKDLQITHEKGLAGSTFSKSERHRLEAAEQYKEAEIKRVAAQDAAAKQADLDRYYANFPEDVGGKRERYLKALNVIAALTNSPSQAGQFMQMAAEKFKTLEGFRGEERLQKIARGVFFDEGGVFDAPASKQDAFNKAMRFGANHDEAMELSGHKAEYAPKSTETGTRIWYNTETGEETWMTKDKAPIGPNWLPKSKPAEKAGTEFERERANAIELIRAGDEEGALAALRVWFTAKNTMMQLMPEQADIVAKYIIENLKIGILPSDEEVRNEGRKAGAKNVPHLGDF